jgi:hypothetical protein
MCGRSPDTRAAGSEVHASQAETGPIENALRALDAKNQELMQIVLTFQRIPPSTPNVNVGPLSSILKV